MKNLIFIFVMALTVIGCNNNNDNLNEAKLIHAKWKLNRTIDSVNHVYNINKIKIETRLIEDLQKCDSRIKQIEVKRVHTNSLIENDTNRKLALLKLQY